MTEKKIPQRDVIKSSDKWDLTPLYTQDETWEKDFDALEKESARYDKYRGRLHESLFMLREAIEFELSVSRRLDRIYTYAHLKSDEDKANQKYLGMEQKGMNLYVKISELSSFLTPEIQSIPWDVMDQYLNSGELDTYRFYLEKIVRYRPHTLSREVEEVLAMTGEMAQAPSDIFGQLDNVDLVFGSLEDEEGNMLEISHGNYSAFLNMDNRDIRKKAFFQYYKSYDDHKNTMAASLAHSIKTNHFYSRVRKFKSCMESSLFSDNVDPEVYDNLISTVKKNLAPLFEYFKFRKGSLGIDTLHFYDTYVPIIKNIKFRMPFDEAADICVKAMAPLGGEYASILKNGFKNRWVDRYENRGKRSGAYSSGCYDSPPYILMNYEENSINGLYTLAHEAGHSMHSYYSKASQPYVYHQYSIFTAEVASTFNETLLSRYLIEYYRDDPRMKAYIINREIDNIRSTIYRQTMFAEFEKITHGIAESGGALTLDVMRGEYRKLLEIYFGNTLTIDDDLSLEFLRIPHFYSAFYVYKYSTGIAAAISLAEKVLSGGGPAREAYLSFLKMGGTAYPIDELKAAGVDMSKPEAVENALKHFEKLVDELIGLTINH